MAEIDRSAQQSFPGKNLNVGARDALHIEDFDGTVLMYLNESSKLLPLVNMNDAIKTSIVVKRSMGKPVINAVTAGVRPESTPIKFGKATVEVDTVLNARQSIFVLDKVQSDIDGLLTPKMAMDQGKVGAEQMDKDILAVLANSAYDTYSQVDGFTDPVISQIALTDIGDTTLLYEAVDELVQGMKDNKGYEPGVSTWVVPTDIYHTLLRNQLLIDRDFTDFAGDTVKGKVLAMFDIPVLEYNNFKSVCTRNNGGYASPLSNADNGNKYDVVAASRADYSVGFIVGTEALMGAESMALTTDVWYNKEEKAYMVDSDFAVGFGVFRPAHIGAIEATVV